MKPVTYLYEAIYASVITWIYSIYDNVIPSIFVT